MGWLSDLLKDYPALSVAKERLALVQERYNQTEEENRRLKEKVKTLSEQNSQLRTQLEALAASPGPAALEDIEIEILKLLSKYSDGIPAVAIAQELRISPTKAEYYTDRMADSELLQVAYFTGSDSLYYLAHAGREYLVKHDLV